VNQVDGTFGGWKVKFPSSVQKRREEQTQIK